MGSNEVKEALLKEALVEALQKALVTYLEQHPEVVEKAISQAVHQNISTPEIPGAERQERVERLINEHFDRFDAVFKALA